MTIHADCTKCIPGEFVRVEWFEYNWNDGLSQKWDIIRAKALLQKQPRLPHRIDLHELPIVLSNYEGGIDAAHVEHVQPIRMSPGIAILRDFKGQNCCLLIDGYHRAAACLKEGRPYWAYFLTDEEAKQCEFK